MAAEEDLGTSLAAVLAPALGDAVTVEGLRRLSGGASRETWAFRARPAEGPTVPLILQRERPGGARTGSGMASEAALLRAAADQGVPVPEVLVTDADPAGEALGRPFMVVRHVEGETIPRKLLRDEEFAEARPVLARQLGEVLARIHRIPTDAVPGLEEQDQVVQFRELLDGFGQPHPAFELGFRWLEAHRPPSTATAVVHGDFRTGNFIVGPEGLRAVLDWEIAHLGDPMEDLGWLCTKAWRFGSPHPVGGFGPFEELFAAYEEHAGTPVDPQVVRWWQTLGTLKWGIMCIIQAATHLSGAVRSVELAAIGRRVCEQEHDLLLLLEEG